MDETFADEKWQHEQGGDKYVNISIPWSIWVALVVWGLVVWDLSRGTLRIRIQFTRGSNRNPNHRAPHHQALPLPETSKWYEFNWILATHPVKPVMVRRKMATFEKATSY